MALVRRDSPRSGFPVSRRNFLRAGSVAVALPALEAFAGPAPTVVGPRNFVAIGTYLGWHQPAFLPRQPGRDYELPQTLAPLGDFRDAFTVFSGLDHRAPNGHAAWSNFLCGTNPGSWSLDQMIADAIGQTSRFPSIELTAGSGEGPQAMSFTKQGVGLPQIDRPSVLYRRLFTSDADRARTDYLLASGASAAAAHSGGVIPRRIAISGRSAKWRRKSSRMDTPTNGCARDDAPLYVATRPHACDTRLRDRASPGRVG